MFPHLRLWLIALWTSSVAGAVVILNLTLGHYTLATFLWVMESSERKCIKKA